MIYVKTRWPKAVARTLREILVAEDILQGGCAIWRIDGLAVLECDGGYSVADWVGGVPECDS